MSNHAGHANLSSFLGTPVVGRMPNPEVPAEKAYYQGTYILLVEVDNPSVIRGVVKFENLFDGDGNYFSLDC